MDENHAGVEETSIWPLLLAVGITLTLAGIVTSLVVTGVGILVLLFSLGGWTQENRSLSIEYPEDEDE